MFYQARIFFEGEGDQWFFRNQEKLRNPDDPVLQIIKNLNLKPESVLEIGCSSGWRLEQLHKDYHCKILTGIEPSEAAIQNGKANFPNIEFVRDIANIRIIDGSLLGRQRYDLIIFGFCLYLCDREDLFEIVSKADRLLLNNGILIIYDFVSEIPHSVPYHHRAELRSFKMDHARLFLANPAYQELHRISCEDGIQVVVLKKDNSQAFPLRELKR